MRPDSPAWISVRRLFGSLVALVTVFSGRGIAADRPVSGLERRTPWTASRMAGTPDAPLPYTVEPAFPHLVFEQPVVLASSRGTDRLFVGEVRGRIYTFPNDPGCRKADLALDLGPPKGEPLMLYGLALHPRFPEVRYVYVCYARGEGRPEGTRVSRFEVSGTNPPRIEPASEKVVITWLSGGHNGGCLAFGKDAFLYISTGDAANPSPPDPLKTGQDVSDLLSSILRIDVDHEEGGKPYRVPADNPFVGKPGVRPEIWAFGFRNPWRMSFDRVTGDLWVGDVGWELWEMADRVVRGGNYGWSVTEGYQPVNVEGRRGPGPILPPTVVHPHSEAASITGGYVYRGNRLRELVGAYLYGDFQTGRIWGLRHDGKQIVWQRELASTPLQLVSFGEDAAGELYALDYERTRQLYRLVPNPAAKVNSDFPRKLSETGLFASTKDHRPAPGVIGYSINAELWSDHARAERFLAVPGSGRIGIDGRGYWKPADGTVLARTVSVELEQGDPRSRRRIETQVLHLEKESWRPYSYIWNDEQSDATLAELQGSSRTLVIRDPAAPGGRRIQEYRFHSRAECVLCHNPWVEKQTMLFGRQSASPLALTTAQLNRDHDYGGTVASQLRTFERVGLFAQPLPAGELPRLADPYDETVGLELRARAYLDVNCAHCHQFNAGGTANILLSQSIPLDQTRTIGVRPIQGTFGIADGRIIAPGAPEGSVLFYRVSKLGGGRMPRVGSNRVDERAVRMLGDWIAQMPASDAAGSKARLSAEDQAAIALLRAGTAAPVDSRARAIRRLLESTAGALAVLRMIDDARLDAVMVREIGAQARNHPRVEVRDLFERFIPDAERVRRLGDSFDPRDILALRGDPGRGRDLFAAESSAQCKNCHRVEGVGAMLGPDLSKIGAKYAKGDLLRHIIEPSREVEPKYAAYLVETKSGQVHAGLLAERSERQVVLKDAQDKEIRIPAAEVAELVAQPKSLMPELLLREMTAQQAADLLEYLASRK